MDWGCAPSDRWQAQELWWWKLYKQVNQMMKMSVSFSRHAYRMFFWCFIQPNHLRKMNSIHQVRTQHTRTQCWRADVSLTTSVISFFMTPPTRASLAIDPSLSMFWTCSSKARGTQNHSWNWSLPDWMSVDSSCRNCLKAPNLAFYILSPQLQLIR